MTNIVDRDYRTRLGGGRAAVRLGVAWAAALLLLSASAARAGDREDKERAAKKACLSGDFAKGVSLLTDLYVDTNDSTYIFNQGRCYEQGNRCEEAIISFREYLRKTKDAGRASDGRAEQHIADCEELLRKTKSTTSPPQLDRPPEKPVDAAQPSVPGPGPMGTTQEVVAQAPQPAASSGSGLRLAGAITFGVGVAAIAAGVGLALAANQLASDLEASPTSYERSKESTRSTYATLSTVGYATGAACAAGGAILYVLGWRQAGNASASVQPMLTAQTAGALVKVAF